MPDFTPSRSDAIREGLIRHAAASLHGRTTVGSRSESAPAPATIDADAPTSRPARRPHGMQWAAAALALILVGGVVGLTATAALNAGAPTAGTPTPSDPSRSQPTTASTRSPSAPATPPPTPAPSSSSIDPLLITAEGIGPYLLGGSFADAREMLGLPGPEELDPSFEDRCPWFASAGDLSPLMTYVIAETVIRDGVTTGTDVIGRVAVQDGGTGEVPLPRTEEGVGLRSTEADVRTAYPDAAEEETMHSDSALRVTEGDTSIVFEFRDGLAYMVTVLPSTEEIPAEYCA